MRWLVLLLCLAGCVPLYPSPQEAVAHASGASLEEVQVDPQYNATDTGGGHMVYIYNVATPSGKFFAYCNAEGAKCSAQSEAAALGQSSSSGSSPHCTKGCPCGGACIDCAKTCHK